MIKSKESLEWVCDSLKNDRKIPCLLKNRFQKNNAKAPQIKIIKRLPTIVHDELTRPLNRRSASPNSRLSKSPRPTTKRPDTHAYLQRKPLAGPHNAYIDLTHQGRPKTPTKSTNSTSTTPKRSISGTRKGGSNNVSPRPNPKQNS